MRAQYPNHVWTYDIVEDRTERGGKLRILNVLDEFGREALAQQVEPSISAVKVVSTLRWLFLLHGAPEYIRSDNGGEFIAAAVKEWLEKSGTRTIYIEPGSPWENPYIESFNGKFRDECLNREVFTSGAEARAVIEAWRIEYNTQRPHSSLGYLTPAEFRESNKGAATGSRLPARLILTKLGPHTETGTENGVMPDSGKSGTRSLTIGDCEGEQVIAATQPDLHCLAENDHVYIHSLHSG
jgi:hypothetical protein